jgi:phage-related holin
MKFLSTIAPAAIVVLLGQLFEKYIFSDWDFIGFLMVAIIIDTITGYYAAWAKGHVTSFRFRSMCEKLFYYFIALVVVHVLTAHSVDGHSNPVFTAAFPYFKGLIYIVLLGAEVLSIDENSAKIGRGFLPTMVRKKIKNIQQVGEVEPRVDGNELI